MFKKFSKFSQLKGTMDKRKNNMSVQPNQDQKFYSPPKQAKQQKSDSVNKIIHPANGVKRVHTVAQGPISVDSVVDPTLLYLVKTPVLPKTRLRHLTFRNSVYIISNWMGDQFPNVLYLSVDGVTGYMMIPMDSETLNTTARVAALQLIQVNSQFDDSQTKRYQLIYQLKDPVTWQVPQLLQSLKIRLNADLQPQSINLPLPNPITLNFEFRQE